MAPLPRDICHVMPNTHVHGQERANLMAFIRDHLATIRRNTEAILAAGGNANIFVPGDTNGNLGNATAPTPGQPLHQPVVIHLPTRLANLLTLRLGPPAQQPEVQPAQPVLPAQPAQPAQTAETAQQTEPAQPVELAEINEPAQPVEPAQAVVEEQEPLAEDPLAVENNEDENIEDEEEDMDDNDDDFGFEDGSSELDDSGNNSADAATLNGEETEKNKNNNKNNGRGGVDDVDAEGHCRLCKSEAMAHFNPEKVHCQICANFACRSQKCFERHLHVQHNSMSLYEYERYLNLDPVYSRPLFPVAGAKEFRCVFCGIKVAGGYENVEFHLMLHPDQRSVAANVGEYYLKFVKKIVVSESDKVTKRTEKRKELEEVDAEINLFKSADSYSDDNGNSVPAERAAKRRRIEKDLEDLKPQNNGNESENKNEELNGNNEEENKENLEKGRFQKSLGSKQNIRM